MKSRITIDFQGVDAPGHSPSQQFEPVIRVHLEDSEDVRDSLMKAFFHSLQYKSNWLRVDFVPQENIVNSTSITIHPVRPDELESTIETMKSRLDE